MWLYRTGNDGKEPIVLFDYQPSRNGDNAVNFLKDFKGYVHSDGYSGYNKLSRIIRCGCWAQLRRKFVEAIPTKKPKDAPLTQSEIGRDYCNQLFKIEEGLKSLSPKGANASAAVYSLVETAKANGLSVYTYLEYLLLYMPDTDWRKHPELLDVLMPWSKDVIDECKR